LSVDIEIDGDERHLARGAEAVLAAVGVADGHLAIQIVDADEMQSVNSEQRGQHKPTDVLAFPVDGTGPVAGPRELGDVIVCPELCHDVTEAVVHGVLHLCGYDHESDDGEMLALQDRIMASL
jgi:probable rRNA maturation factor